MTSPTGFEVMVAEQNRWPEMQRLLGGSYLTIAFCQVGAQHLIGDVSMGGFLPIVLEKFQKDIMSKLYSNLDLIVTDKWVKGAQV